MAIIFKLGGDYEIDEDEMIKLTAYEGKAKIVHTADTVNNLKSFKKLNSEEYYDKVEKKVKRYRIREYRTGSGIRNSMNKVKDYLIHNFNGGKNELFLTLTYQEQMCDMDQLKKDYDYFWKRLKKQYQDLEYLYVVEMQEDRNSLHLHVLLKDTKHKTLYIPYEDLTRLWNKGYIWVSKINLKETAGLINASNKNEKTAIGRVIKYMTKVQSKFKVPKNKNIYSKSKGIVAPAIIKMTYKEAEKFVNHNEYEFSYGYAGKLMSTKYGFIVGTIKGQIFERKE